MDSQDNKFAAAYTNNNEIVLLNTLVSEFVKIENPFREESEVESVRSQVTQVAEYNVQTEIQGMKLLEGRLVVYSSKSWVIFDMAGNKVGEETSPSPGSILRLQMLALDTYSIISWSGNTKF